MSQSGPPTDPQEPGPGEGGPTPQQPYSPYPSGWDQPGQPGQASPPNPSPYGQPYGQQQNPYGQPAPYGQPVPPYGQPQPPGAPTNPYAAAGRPDRPTFGFSGYAGWFTRVGAFLIDQILGLVAGFPIWIGYAMLFSDATTTTAADGSKQVHFHPSGATTTLIWIGVLTSLAFFVWNLCIRQGRTGASYGKSVLAVRLVNSDLQPIGPGLSFLRQLLHIVDTLPCYLGYLWPIWDSRKQTFSDKIMQTFVIHATEQQPRPY
jgi:uncharacterized RDD family membrane protein YckC